MDYLKELGDTPFEMGVKLAEASIPKMGNGNPYMDGLIANPTQPEHDNIQRPAATSNSKFDLESFKPKVYEIETRGGKIKDRPGSQYSGIAQLGRNERTPILKSLGITDQQYKSDIGLQKKVADVWFDSLANRLGKSGFEVNNLNLWTAHNLGVGGLNQVLHNKVSKQTLSNIRNQAGMDENSTVDDYLAYYGDRLK